MLLDFIRVPFLVNPLRYPSISCIPKFFVNLIQRTFSAPWIAPVVPQANIFLVDSIYIFLLFLYLPAVLFPCSLESFVSIVVCVLFGRGFQLYSHTGLQVFSPLLRLSCRSFRSLRVSGSWCYPLVDFCRVLVGLFQWEHFLLVLHTVFNVLLLVFGDLRFFACYPMTYFYQFFCFLFFWYLYVLGLFFWSFFCVDFR